MKWRPNLLNCAYVAGSDSPGAGNFAFVSLYNNDNLGRLYAILDIGKGGASAVLNGYQVQNKQVGSNAVAASPLVTNQGAPTGQLTTGAAAALPTLGLQNGLGAQYGLWPHDFPLIVLAQGWSITAWSTTAAAALSIGFLYEIVDMATVADLYQPPTLVIPKVLKLSVETE